MAARACESYRRVMWEVARLRLRMLLDATWPGGSTADPYPFVGTAAVPATLADTLRSERLLAMALRWHVKRPTHVVDAGAGYGARVVNWGNGSGVPDEDTNVVIVGTDGSGHLHIRIFPDDDKGKTRLIDTDETQLPASQAAAIASLRGKLPPLLPPHKLTDDEKAMVVREATAILGLSHWPGRGLVSAWKTPSQQALFSGHLDVTTWGAAHEAAWAEELLAAFKKVREERRHAAQGRRVAERAVDRRQQVPAPRHHARLEVRPREHGEQRQPAGVQ